MSFMRVLLPAPFSPSRASTSPARPSKSTASLATTSPKRQVTWRPLSSAWASVVRTGASMRVMTEPPREVESDGSRAHRAPAGGHAGEGLGRPLLDDGHGLAQVASEAGQGQGKVAGQHRLHDLDVLGDGALHPLDGEEVVHPDDP